MPFTNVYQDSHRASSYAALDFPGTYYLAYRDLPDIISRYVKGRKALDFGCGTGRSTRFLEKLGFDTIGIDIASAMIAQAQKLDPTGRYLLIEDGDMSVLEDNHFDLALSIFTFDNIPSYEHKVHLFTEIARKLNDSGILINLVSSPEIYVHEWASFTTKDFPENLTARSGDLVRIVMTDVVDARPVEDIMWSDEAYRNVYQQAGFKLLATYHPLGREDEPFNWVNEREIAPWSIYVLGKSIPDFQ